MAQKLIHYVRDTDEQGVNYFAWGTDFAAAVAALHEMVNDFGMSDVELGSAWVWSGYDGEFVPHANGYRRAAPAHVRAIR